MLLSTKLLNKTFSSITDSSIKNWELEKQNSEYEGLTFQFSNQHFRSRLAKKTPKKKGYFVALWKKDENNVNQAYSYSNSPEKVIILIIDEEKLGQFIFPKSILLEKGILKTKIQKGKMAFRVYPTWESSLNNSAAKTQKWQQPYFVDLSNSIDLKKVRLLIES
ncbi:MepB family protein [Tetragenococcus koreensis]|uniref:MepB family protein n=1 Tax=Tetragenococcus koreensis TaxID=290335 RepID=UPI000F4D6F8F|nr:MepB family protein [Tetragenococcus koreensis]AYW45051.1 MepB protein [Tetragenococcus koreensis]GEN92289.1 hypothetical protein TKO01_23350 [Tetragenococcus koreensis]